MQHFYMLVHICLLTQWFAMVMGAVWVARNDIKPDKDERCVQTRAHIDWAYAT